MNNVFLSLGKRGACTVDPNRGRFERKVIRIPAIKGGEQVVTK